MTIKQFPRLYTIDSKDKVRIFDCRVFHEMNPSSAQQDKYYTITSTGLLKGKLTEKADLVKTGKQNRTIKEQALFQAEALWKAKFNEGYKSEELIRIKCEQMFGTSLPIEEAIFKVPNCATTNSNWDFLPMLAHKYKDIKNLHFPYLSQPKLNGVRCLARVTSPNGDVLLSSRGGEYYKVPHIQEQLLLLVMELATRKINEDFIFDGELYVHGIPLQDISGAARTEVSGIFASNNWLEYHIYDIISLQNLKEKQESRVLNLLTVKIVATDAGKYPHIKFVQTKKALDKTEVKELHDQYIEEGYEGAILRDGNGTYEFNQRSRSLIKVKEYEDAEFKIVGYQADTENVEDSFVFVLENNENKATFEARPTGTRQQKRKWYSQISELIGNFATVRFQERSKDGLPIQGHVRHKETECLIEHIRPNGE